MPTIRVLSLSAALIVSSVLLFAGCGGDDDKDWQGETITLGSIFSTSGDGVAFGPQQLKAAQLAIDDINGEDDGINGATLELAQKNDRSDPTESAKVMKSLIESEDVLAVLGPTFSNSAAEADPVANDRKTPVLAVSNTGPGIVGDCSYECDFIFRDSLGEADAIPANIETLATDSSTNSALVIYPKGDPFGRKTAAISADSFEKNGVNVTMTTTTSPVTIPLVHERFDAAMITASSGETAARLIKVLRGTGFEGPILGGNAFNSQLAAKDAGTAGKGAQSAAAWYAGNDSEENQEFIADYKAKYNDEPDQFAAQAYTGVQLLAEAAEDADLSFNDLAADRDALKNALETVEEETPLGAFKFTADHDVNQPIWIVEMNGQGSYNLLKELPPE